MSKSKLTYEFLQKHYVEEGKSTVEIANMLGTFPETVRRALKRLGIPVRSRSKASRNYYKQGGVNPRKGYEYTEEEKERASVAAKEYWLSDNSEDARQKIAEASRKYWDGVSETEKRAIVSRLHQACRDASINGSKTQNFLADILASKYGYNVHTGMTAIAGLGNFEIDIAIPDHAIAIEVDGIAHFEEVFSDNRYERAIEEDERKNKQVTGAGWSMIRIQLKCDRFSKGSCFITAEELNELIQNKKFKKRGVTTLEMN